ncbi:MAG: malto-oligosyltrehalose trehalohydrolase [Vicinamibacterales bacterium]
MCPGATWQGAGSTAFRVWAPAHHRVRVVFERGDGAMERAEALVRDPDGHFRGTVADTAPGLRYRYELDDGSRLPDPASRYQPEGPHGPSEIVDPSAFAWTDASWAGVRLPGQVLYELHVGTFTPGGTWRAAARELPRLAAIGITTVEMMPVAEFAGDWGWGYDGVDLFAPSHLYGRPDDLRFFVDQAHRAGLGVILDVVYNHFGPDGNYLSSYSPHYASTRYANEWGEAINFDDAHAGPVREFMAENAAYWVREFHMDGLRVDATQQMFDATRPHVLALITARARAAAGRRSILLVAESERQDADLLKDVERGGHGFDAVWNDDFHHAALVALTGRREAYYTDYAGSPQELLSAVKWGYLYQGQRYSWQKARRGSPALGIAAPRFITYLENHDQVANGPTGFGERVHQLSSPALYRAMTACWLLSPGTPLFFQGQEYGAREPFLFFAAHAGELGEAVRRGRAQFMTQFRSAATRPLADDLPPPSDRSTFEACRLSGAGGGGTPRLAELHRSLLRLRRDDPVFRSPGAFVDGAVIATHVLVMRWFAADPRAGTAGREAETRLLIVNLGIECWLESVPEPLLAPPAGHRWAAIWSSEDVAFGGAGTAPLDTDEHWRLPARSAVALSPIPHHDADSPSHDNADSPH